MYVGYSNINRPSHFIFKIRAALEACVPDRYSSLGIIFAEAFKQKRGRNQPIGIDLYFDADRNNNRPFGINCDRLFGWRPAIVLRDTSIWSLLSLLLTLTAFIHSASAQNISTVAGNGTNGFSGDGSSATTASLFVPVGIALDSSGNLYISDNQNNRIRKVVGSTGIISTVAGTGLGGALGDGGAATSASLSTQGLTIDSSNNLYFASDNFSRIRKVSLGSGTISLFAGGSFGFAGDGGSATSASLNTPVAVAVDLSGNLYIADSGNHVIRKVASGTGIITTVAGIGGSSGFTGDGGAATAAKLNNPSFVTADSSSNLYIADTNNHVIRKVSSGSGTITTIAGIGGSSGFSGDGGGAISAKLNGPQGLAVDALGNLFVADQGNYVIRKIAAGTGTITTVAGTGGSAGYSGDGGAATNSKLNGIVGITLDGSGNLFLSDKSNHVIRKISAITPPSAPMSVSATAGDGQATITFMAPIAFGSTITDYMATSSPDSKTGTCSGASACTITVTGLTNGTAYTFTVTATNSVGTGTASGASSSVTPTSGTTTTTNTPPPPPPWVGTTTNVVPPTIKVTPTLTLPGTTPGPAGPLSAAYTLPASLFSRNDLAFAIGLLNSPGTQVTSTSSVNGVITLNLSVTGATIKVTFNSANQTFNFSVVPVVRQGGRGAQSSVAALIPVPAESKTKPTSASSVAAAIPSAIQVTGPSVILPTANLNLTATAPDGTSYAIPLPLNLVVPGTTATLTAASVDAGGSFGTAASTNPVLSRDGRVLSFVTTAPNLGFLINNATSQVMRYAVPIGTVDTVSQSNFMGQVAGQGAWGGPSLAPSLSADGRWLAFASDATNIFPYFPASKARQVYLARGDQAIASFSTTSPSSAILDARGNLLTAANDRPSLSADGTWLAFESDNALAGSASGRQIYVKNMTTGVTALVSSTATGVSGNGPSTSAQISDDGTMVLFESDATNFGLTGHQIWLKNLTNGALTLVSAANDGTPGNATSTNAKLSGDGRYAVFESDATNLVSGTNPGSRQVYVRSIATGTTSLASIGFDGKPAGAAAASAAISGDGRFIVFQSGAANLISGTAPSNAQVYVRDQFAARTVLVSSDVSGKPANGNSTTPTISSNGRVIAFVSAATNLDGTQTNGVSQVYLAGNPITAPIGDGYWVSSAFPGRGITIEQSGNQLFAGPYSFANDNTALWQVGFGSATGTNGAAAYSGSFSTAINGTTLTGPYRAPSGTIVTGPFSLAFTDASNGTIATTGAVAPLQRQEFSTGAIAAGPTAGYPETGWWWNSSQPGQAVFLEVQGTTMLATLYFYDSRGQPTWYQAQGAMSTANAFTGSVQLCSNGASVTCANTTSTLALSFASTLAGTLTLTTSQAAKPLVYEIQRFRF